jgi:hypothetical protein
MDPKAKLDIPHLALQIALKITKKQGNGNAPNQKKSNKVKKDKTDKNTQKKSGTFKLV